MTRRMKRNPDDRNEVLSATDHRDVGQCRITALAEFEPRVAQAVVTTLREIVRQAHAAGGQRDAAGLLRAQSFEEGEVFMVEAPFEGYFADRYLMEFYDVEQRDTCSRMHIHTGLRFVRMMTGPSTIIRVSSFSPIVESPRLPGTEMGPAPQFTDTVFDESSGTEIQRHNYVVEPNRWVDMQIPRGVSHQFNAMGEYAMIDSVHPEESIETLREGMSDFRMMAQTVFLAEERPTSDSCIITAMDAADSSE